MKLKPKYSGKDSAKFWKRINEIKNRDKADEAYSLAVVLQNVELDILRLINLINHE